MKDSSTTSEDGYFARRAEARTADNEEVIADHKRLVRELDVALNGEAGAARQASLCDLVAQVQRENAAGDANVVIFSSALARCMTLLGMDNGRRLSEVPDVLAERLQELRNQKQSGQRSGDYGD